MAGPQANHYYYHALKLKDDDFDACSDRFSAYTSTTISSTVTTTFTDIDDGLRRMEDDRLMKQRFVPTDKKENELSKLALGAKLERALRWRMDGQDYVRRVREKSG
jgi:hypothetical protein